MLLGLTINKRLQGAYEIGIYHIKIRANKRGDNFMYGILRTNKIKLNSITKKYQKHIQRESNYYHSNPDINVDKQNEDVILVYSKDFKKSIFEELKKHNITKEPKKNAVGLIDGVLTASPAFFDNMSKENAIDFFKNALPLIQREYGPIISAAVHVDEKNLHLHFCCTPIIENSEGNYKLCAKEVMGNRQEYVAKQDRFYEEFFKNYGLERGQSVKETSREHIEHNRFKAQKAREEYLKNAKKTNEQKGVNQELIIQQAELESQIKEGEQRQKELLSESSKALESYEETLTHINQHKEQKKRLEGQIEGLEEIYLQLQDELLQIANDSEISKELLKRSIFENDYDNIEEFKQRVMESDEANEIWENMKDFYDDFMQSVQEIEYDDMEWQ